MVDGQDLSSQSPLPVVETKQDDEGHDSCSEEFHRA